MHPLGTYLAIRDIHREDGWAQTKVPPTAIARVDALPIIEPEPVSRVGRLAAKLRRHVVRTAGA